MAEKRRPVIATSGEPIDASGAVIEMREWSHGPNEGPPLHVHNSDDEAWHVLEGTLRFHFAGGVVDARAGETVFVPTGVAHTFGNPGPEPVRYIVISTPRVFELIRALHEDEGSQEPSAIYRRFDSELVE